MFNTKASHLFIANIISRFLFIFTIGMVAMVNMVLIIWIDLFGGCIYNLNGRNSNT
jgi:hypothetical protein